MNKTKVKEIIKFSLYKNMQNKWFIIFNVITLIGTILIINWPHIANTFHFTDENEVYDVAIIDKENLVYHQFVQDLSGDSKYRIQRIEKNDYTAETIPNYLMIIEISGEQEKGIEASIISKEGILTTWYNPIKEELQQIRNELLAKQYGIKKQAIEMMQKEIEINRVMLSVSAEDSTTKEMVKLFSSAATYFIMVFIFSKMANEIASEKQSKSTEYILTTVSEKEYLFAKIFSSITLLILQGIFMIIYYAIAALLFSNASGIERDLSVSASTISSAINKDLLFYILTLIVYNVFTLILLCIIQATLASKTSSTSEAGNSASLLLFIMIAAYISTIYFLKPYEKASILLYIISCIPFLSAYFVPGMMVIGQATIWQIAISLLTLIISIPITFHFCAKIFKNGVLDYTKVSRKKEKSQEEQRKNFLTKREMKHFGFVIGIAIIIYVGTQIIFSLIGNVVLTTLLGKIVSDTDITMILQALLQIISLGLASWFILIHAKEKPEKEMIKRIPAKKKIKLVFITLFLIFVIQIVLSVLLYPYLGLDYDTTDIFKVDASSGIVSKIILIITLSIIPAIFEELFFRKAVIDFSIKQGKAFALLFSALLFGLLHMNLSQGLFAFIMGLLWGVIYIYTGDIRLTILAHFLNNGFAAFSLILPEMMVMVLAAIMLIIVACGAILLIKELAKKESRKRIMALAHTQINLKCIKEKYQYIFTNYAFDIAILLVVLMSIVTEKILR